MSAFVVRDPNWGVTQTGYTNDFAAAQNPLSSTDWLLGATDGLDWLNPESTGGHCVATSTSSSFNDNIAQLKSATFAANAKQYAKATVYRAVGYTPPAPDYHEIELHVHQSIAAHSATGYECGWGLKSDGTAYYFIVIWLGALGSFDTLYASAAGDIPVPQQGYTMEADITPNAGNTTASIVLTFKDASGTPLTIAATGLDGTKGSVGTGTFTWNDVTLVNGHTTVHSYLASGQPGLGFYPEGASTPGSLGWDDFTCGNL